MAVLSVSPCTMITTNKEQKIKEIFEVWKEECDSARIQEEKKTMTSIMIMIIVINYVITAAN